MASPAQITANRDNAQRSTGPQTLEGKQTSSRNSTRHGLTGTQIVVPGEDPAEYEELRRGFHQSHKPATDAERVLVEQIAANAWRLMRAQRVEAAFLAKLAEGAENAYGAIAEAFLERPKDVARMQRYVTAAHNAFYKAISELSKLQKERVSAEDATEADGIDEENIPCEAAPGTAIGFVSYVGPTDPAVTISGNGHNWKQDMRRL